MSAGVTEEDYQRNSLAKKILPRLTSYIPFYGLDHNLKKDYSIFANNHLQHLSKDSIKTNANRWGFIPELTRNILTGIVWSTTDLETALIFYGGVTYIADTASKFISR